MSNNGSTAMEDHKAWSESVSQRLERIYNDLCNYEQQLNEEDPMKLMELLESVNELHEATTSIRQHETLVDMKRRDLQEQMRLLQQSVELLKLESNCSDFQDR